MKQKILILSILTTLSAWVFLFLSQKVLAADFKVGNEYENQVSIPSDKTIDDNLFAVSQDIEIEGTVIGDVFALGNTVNISGTIEGNLFVAGRLVNLTGKVRGTVFAAASSLVFDGETDKNIFAAAESANLNGRVGKEVFVGTTSLNLGGKTQIVGNLNYASRDFSQSDQATIGGKTVAYKTQAVKPTLAARISSLLIGFLMLAVTGMVLIFLFPLFSKKTAEVLQQEWGRALLWGLALLILTPIAAIILMTTLFGIPIAIGLVFGYIAIIYLSKVIVSFFIGQKLGQEKYHPLWSYFLGALILTVFFQISFLSGIVALATVLLGSGACVIALKNYQKKK